MIELVTLFGGGGFVGRYVAQELLRQGVRIRIAQRVPRDAWFVKSYGGLGQTQFVAADVTRPETVARALEGADAAINLVGLLSDKLQKVHVDGARNVAQLAAQSGLKALVHVSAIGADRGSPSEYGRTKGEGEDAAGSAFPGTTIVRPSVVFGPEDDFVNRFARMAQFLPVVPVIRGSVKFQPVYVADVARAIVAAVLDPGVHSGKSYELGGPEVVTMAELNALVARMIGRMPTLVPVPDIAASAMARFGSWVPGAPITWDQWLMLGNDNIVAEGAAGFEAFGIEPAPIEAVAPGWLVQYRKHGRFSLTGKTA